MRQVINCLVALNSRPDGAFAFPIELALTSVGYSGDCVLGERVERCPLIILPRDQRLIVIEEWFSVASLFTEG